MKRPNIKENKYIWIDYANALEMRILKQLEIVRHDTIVIDQADIDIEKLKNRIKDYKTEIRKLKNRNYDIERAREISRAN